MRAQCETRRGGKKRGGELITPTRNTGSFGTGSKTAGVTGSPAVLYLGVNYAKYRQDKKREAKTRNRVDN